MIDTNKKIQKLIKQEVIDIVHKSTTSISQETYLVGGAVRDHLIDRNRKNSDFDFVTIGCEITLANEIKNKLNKNLKINRFKNFGTAHLNFNKINIEIVKARKESYHSSSRNPDVEPGTLLDDLKRRDFTINSMAVSLNNKNFGELIDPFDGLNDLENRIIKTPTNPEITISDDPLRILRGVRFSSELNFEIDDSLLNSMIKNCKRIKIISKERIVDEINKILITDKPSNGLKLLDKVGLIEILIPSLNKLKGIEEIEGVTHKDNFFHTLEVLDNISKVTNKIWLRWAALLHDIGKPKSKRFDEKIGWTFHGHEYIGSKMIFKIFKKLKMPLNSSLKYVQKIVLLSSRPIILSESIVTESAVRRLIYDAGDEIEDLLMLCEADITTKNKRRYEKYLNNFKIVRQKIKIVEERDKIRNFQPPISGKFIMNVFNLKPSKEVGILKEKIKDAILDGKIPNEHNAAFKLLLKEAMKMGLKPKINEEKV
ncbi:MAG: tRNA nucleotidyltransferase [Flavobacteriaceae bacterium]|nr:tRNA nucleotidyltransferase [Flavobacteriaceae bacterium]|tara:strand:- start:1237 stop:2688 length:1452 start_codon:yes stop_codon:yes gene_type:complete